MLASGDLLAIFLSTPSARRATHQVDHVRHIGVISIHALREEGDPDPLLRRQERSISIHALREEGDQADRPEITTHCAISIHALREEGDFESLVN